MTPEFLELEEVLEIHSELVDRYGGSQGVRDLGLLQSALAMPQAGSGGAYFHVDLFEMAAAYLFHIVKNHPFVDGNKRTGAVTALEFIWLNGVSVSAPSASFEKLILAVAESRSDKAAIAAFLGRHAKS